MRNNIAQSLLLAVLAIALTVEAQLYVSSDSILILHGSTSELIITYTKPPVDSSWFGQSDEAFRYDNKPLIRVPDNQLTKEINNIPEDIRVTDIDISKEEVRPTYSENMKPATLESLSLLNETQLYDFNPASDNNTLPTLIVPSGNTLPEENITPKELTDKSDAPFQINQTENPIELSEVKKASEKIAEEINALKVEADMLKLENTISSTTVSIETEFQNSSSLDTEYTPANDIAVYNTSLEINTIPSEATTMKSSVEVTNTSSFEAKILSLERNSSSKEGIENRKKRDLDTSSMSIEATDWAISKRTISLSVNSDYALTVSRNLLEVNESLSVQSWRVTLYGWHPGNVILLIRLEPTDLRVSDVVVHVDVERSHFWSVASSVIGWIYFVGWGFSAQFQFFENWRRKSVVGLNFDYLGYNMLGHSLYGIYNYVLYSSRPVQEEFFLRYPLSANPIQINDVVFSAHNSLVTLLTIFQCFYYQRGNQRVSRIAFFVFTIYGTWLFFSGFLAVLHRIEWLDFINQCALIKFTITFIKYAPQAYMNYKRKSTVGWSIGAILLDFTGGLFSLVQMMILAYNFDDWASFRTDTTKLGLACFTLMFDFLFMAQHYILYSDNDKKRFQGNSERYRTEDIRPNSCYINPAVPTKESYVG